MTRVSLVNVGRLHLADRNILKDSWDCLVENRNANEFYYFGKLLLVGMER